MNVIKGLALSLLLFLCTAANLNAQSRPTGKPASQDPFGLGHSTHGDAFDEGPREKPWIMEGIGKSHFPITTSNPEVQMWFDQGHTLLHNFWYYEAERAFAGVSSSIRNAPWPTGGLLVSRPLASPALLPVTKGAPPLSRRPPNGKLK